MYFETTVWIVGWSLQNPRDIFSNLMSDPPKNSSGRGFVSEKIFHIKRKTKNPSDVAAKNNTKKNVCSNIHQTVKLLPYHFALLLVLLSPAYPFKPNITTKG